MIVCFVDIDQIFDRLDPPHLSEGLCSDLFTFNGLELEAIVCFVDY